jgi:hypothetical protein
MDEEEDISSYKREKDASVSGLELFIIHHEKMKMQDNIHHTIMLYHISEVKAWLDKLSMHSKWLGTGNNYHSK